MSNQKQRRPYLVAFIGVMAALVFIVTYFRFPFMGSQLHFANALCLLAGMLFGGPLGAIAAGLGSALYDLIGFYGPVEALITFLNKGLMALVCGLILSAPQKRIPGRLMSFIASTVGALLYVALYLFKTYITQRFILHSAPETIGAMLISKAVPSLMNAAFAAIVAPLLYAALKPALEKVGLYRMINPPKS